MLDLSVKNYISCSNLGEQFIVKVDSKFISDKLGKSNICVTYDSYQSEQNVQIYVPFVVYFFTVYS